MFYWPGLYRDVRDYCRSCHQCQKSSPCGTRRAPLIPLPIIDVSFRRVAMDIVGPLPRSSTGKRFILVICDYATRYPEAIALRTIDANQIARTPVGFFSRVWLPEEIAYYSRQLLSREERYSAVEKECLLIKLATHAFRVYLLGKQFLIQTDHRSLKWLDQLKACLTRWSLSLQPFCYTVEYRAGSCNGNADGFSRAFADTTSSQEKGEEM